MLALLTRSLHVTYVQKNNIAWQRGNGRQTQPILGGMSTNVTGRMGLDGIRPHSEFSPTRDEVGP